MNDKITISKLEIKKQIKNYKKLFGICILISSLSMLFSQIRQDISLLFYYFSFLYAILGSILVIKSFILENRYIMLDYKKASIKFNEK